MSKYLIVKQNMVGVIKDVLSFDNLQSAKLKAESLQGKVEIYKLHTVKHIRYEFEGVDDD